MTTPRNRTFYSHPATLVIHRPGGNEELWIADRIEWEDDDPRFPIVLTHWAMGGARYFTLNSLDETTQDLWSGVNTGPAETKIEVRPTQEDDSVASVTMEGLPRIPMPLAVIASLHASNGEFTMPTLWAMSEDDGFVATMMLNTEDGLFVRYSSQWHKITDDDVVDGLNTTEVDAAALEMFDQFDRAGQLVHVGAMHKDGQPVQTYEVVPAGPGAVGEPTEQPVTAAVTKPVPMLSSAEDLPAALAAAEADPDLRWWVERRILALGLETDLPWSSS